MIRLKSMLTEQQQTPTQLMLQRQAIMQDALAKLTALEPMNDFDVDETVASVDNAVAAAYIAYCSNMQSHMKTSTEPLMDLPWGTEITNMIARIKQDVNF